MRIGELAVASGTTTKTLRFYEEAGLLPAPERTANGYRDYTPAALARLDFVRRGRTAGLTLAQIREILDIRDAGVAPCQHVHALLEAHLATWTAKSPTCKHCDTPSRTFTTVPPPATPPNATPRLSAAICDQTGARVYRHEQMPPQSVDRTPPYNGESHSGDGESPAVPHGCTQRSRNKGTTAQCDTQITEDLAAMGPGE